MTRGRGDTLPVMWTRRELLGGAAVAWSFLDDTMAHLTKLDPAQGGPDDEAFWRQVRQHFDVDPDSTCFNHAGLSPSPRAVRAALSRQTARTDVDPSRVLWRLQEKELDGVRARLGALLGCTADEVALTPNATFGLHTAILGLPLQAGGEIVFGAHEYSRARHALRQRQQRDGAVLVEVPLATPAAPPAEVAAAVLAACTSRTSFVVLSQMTYLTGQLLPVAEVAAALAKRGVPLVVDGAHGIGLLPATVSALGGACYTACLHKWVMGPVGTGVFVCQPAWIERIWPLCPGEADDDRRVTKFEQYGTRAAAPFLALHEALDFHEWLGRERKAARLEWLRARLVRGLDGVPGAVPHSSHDAERARGIWTVGLERSPARALVHWLWQQHRVHVTAVTTAGLDAIRIAPNVFTSAVEVDRLAGLLRTAARDGI